MTFQPSKQLVDFIARCENFRSVAYKPLPTDRYTFGYGCTYFKGKPIGPGDTISQEDALLQLTSDLEKLGLIISGPGLPSNLTQEQFDAVVSLVYNIGFGTFKSSDTGRLFYAGQDISDRFKLYNRSGGQVITGLVNRREKEKEIYTSGIYS
jgi:GH24 family phage-related lysozyme (muramidase)